MTPILLIIKLLREGLDRILIPKKSCMQMFSTVLRPFAETRFTDPTLEVGTITRNAGCGDGGNRQSCRMGPVRSRLTSKSQFFKRGNRIAVEMFAF